MMRASSSSGSGDGLNAKTVPTTLATGTETYGELNQHPTGRGGTSNGRRRRSQQGGGGGQHRQVGHDDDDDEDDEEEESFRVGVSVDRNKKCRRTMEDAHSFIYDFGGIKGQGFFAIFDGHAGKHAAEWCGMEFHKHLLSKLNESGSSSSSRREEQSSSVPWILNETFQQVDDELSRLASTKNLHSGCTAVVAFLRLEDESGNPVGANRNGLGQSVVVVPSSSSSSTTTTTTTTTNDREEEKERQRQGEEEEEKKEEQEQPGARESRGRTEEVKVTGPAEVVKGAKKRTLYIGNVGDARAVLSRGGKGVRLSYDHKGTDTSEVKRITDAGGFVLNNRVNGVLAVTRALGDSSMKEFVVGKPYTTETTIGDHDEWLIVACDGLWDVCSDQEAVEIVQQSRNAQDASQRLLDHALANFSTDNLSVLVVDLKPSLRTTDDNNDVDEDEDGTKESDETRPDH
ncbi:hypothetical protein JCM3766R1_004890 [Sporobolomyces carnicolor]